MSDIARTEGGEGARLPARPAGPNWDDWEDPPRLPAIPVLHLAGFDGPMDLLLDLAERQRIDLGRMSVQALAEQFVAALDMLVGRVPLEQRADWLVMAARLVLLRSRLLFPPDPAAADAAAREATAELDRIAALVALRRAAAWLQQRPQLGIEVFARPPPAASPAEGGYVALMEACLAVLRGRAGRPQDATQYRPAIADLWRVPDALARIRVLLAANPADAELARFLPEIEAADANRPLKLRAAFASTLLAGLELAREGVARIEQDAMFAAIRLQAIPGKGDARDSGA